PCRIDEPAALAGFLLWHPFVSHRRHDQVANADPGFASTQEQHLLVGESSSGQTNGRVQPGQRHCRRSLDIVVERADALTILLEQTESIDVRKVLELQQAVGEALL